MVRLAFIIAFLEITRLISPYLLKLVVDRIANFDPQKLKELLGLVALMFLTDSFVSIVHYFKDKKIFAFLIKKIYYNISICLYS